MPIIRDYAQRDVLYIGDYPLVNEQKSGIPFSEFSHSELKHNLMSGSVRCYMAECLNIPVQQVELTGEFIQEFARFEKTLTNPPEKHILGINQVNYTYLSTTRPEKGDTDFLHSVVSKKGIPEGKLEEYKQCEWLKDVWVTTTVYQNILETIHQIQKVQPKLIICGGKWSMLFLGTFADNLTMQLATIAGTKTTIKKQMFFGALNTYRASKLTVHSYFNLYPIVLIPILTPSYHWVVRDKAEIIRKDYAKAAFFYRRLKEGVDVKEFLKSDRFNAIAYSKEKALAYLRELLYQLETTPTKVVFDVETRQQGIDCIGICYNPNYSMTIPFTEFYYTEAIVGECAWVSRTVNGKKTEVFEEVSEGTRLTKYKHYWDIDSEVEITDLLQKVMLHPNCLHVGQNYLYDCQFYYRELKLSINAVYDTMIRHHVLYNYMQKDLALLASMYCSDYVYWKSEIHSTDNEVRWRYNGKDVCYTLSIDNILERILTSSSPKLQEFYKFQQNRVCKATVSLMNRGVPIDVELKEDMYKQFKELMDGCLDKLRYVFNEPEFNPNSTPQVKTAFKTLLGIKPIVNRKTKAESFGADAMLVYLEEYPEYRSLLTLFLEYKSIKVFVNTFLSAKLSADGKMRCSYNPAGTKTYRFNSRKNIDGGGLNLQNVPSKGKIKLHYALQELASKEEDSEEDLINDGIEDTGYTGTLELPNCKRMFVPPKDYIFFDADYSAIDLHFVVWESDCQFLKTIIKAGKDTYSVLASHYYQRDIVKIQDEYTGKWDWPPERQIFKSVGHGSNYLGKPTTLAAKAGLHVLQVKRVQDWYFSECPEIPEWHSRIDGDLKARRYTENIFGARFWCMDMSDPMYLNKAVAAVPQSSAGILVNKALCNLEESEKGKIQVLMQVHDSLAGIYHKDDITALARIKGYLEMEIPYKDKLIIPAQIKTSNISYGDCH